MRLGHTNPSTPNANAAWCHKCDCKIESTFRHDFQPCDCLETDHTRIFVDGGNDYFRFGCGDKAHYSWWSDGQWKPETVRSK